MNEFKAGNITGSNQPTMETAMIINHSNYIILALGLGGGRVASKSLLHAEFLPLNKIASV